MKVDRDNRGEDEKNDEDGEQEARGQASAAPDANDAEDQPIEDEEAKKLREEENQRL